MAERPFRVVMTLMVKNERDIVAAMIEHHLAQGIDHIIVTDNGSDDGTREVLADYAASAPVTVLDEGRDDFPQAEVVTGMARRAFREHGATWVLNSDADEFWVADDEALTVAEALATAPVELGSFNVPVTNMLGRPLEDGGALSSHVWRDVRSEDALKTVGLHAHPTHNLAHVGANDVEVAAGNHFSSLSVADDDAVPASARLRTYHYPWRTWSGFHRRTVAMGTAHERSGRQPSPRHHIMRDLRWERAGVLEFFFVARHPDLSARDDHAGEGFERDDRIARLMSALSPKAVRPERLAEVLVDAQPYPIGKEQALRERFDAMGGAIVSLEEQRADEVTNWRLQADALRAELDRRPDPEEVAEQLRVAAAEVEMLEAALLEKDAQLAEWTTLWNALRENPLGRLAMTSNVPFGRLKRALGSTRGRR